ncbi:MAG: LD-carboxypeptidase [Clostridiales bacterium]|nr:LD-carboxypeptidase [Clostridiales bacterium]MDD6389368.1 LD-carboxypeptidase [Bacillota bacterium]MDY5976395.1 LD-carboxypeptidase [Anaerovoracaceae bacterium]
MISEPLKKNGTIGICSPCHIAGRQEMMLIGFQLRQMGFTVKESDNIYSNTYGYAATPEEKAHDLMQLICDDEVGLVLFGGGEGCVEVLPYLDFEEIKKHPKRICAFSDSTTLLNSIWANTGMEVYYGLAPSDFMMGLSDYNRLFFEGHILSRDMNEHIPYSKWILCNEGVGEGILFGGYSNNVALMLGSRYFPIDKSQDYILFVEDHERFGGLDYVSAMIGHIEQNPIMDNIKGVLFGHYSVTRHPELYERLKRFGEAFNIPVAYCDDFGHGDASAILPIGRKAVLDTVKGSLTYK